MSYKNLHNLVDYARQMQTKDDNDVFIGVTGPKGSGKTTFSIEFSRFYIKKYFNQEYFNLKKYVAFNNSDVFDKMHELPLYSPIVGDEGIRFAWSRDWNKSDNKDLTRLSTQIRPKKHILFMNIPKLVWIDKAYREGMLDLWAWIHSSYEDGVKRSYALMFEPDQNQGESDSWHLKFFQKKRAKLKRVGKHTPIDTLYKIVRNHPCFIDIVSFPKVPNDLYKQYLEIRQSNVTGDDSEYINQKDLAKLFTYNLIDRWDKFINTVNEGRFDRPTLRAIADCLSYDPSRGKQRIQYSTVGNWLKEIREQIPPQKTLNYDFSELPGVGI